MKQANLVLAAAVMALAPGIAYAQSVPTQPPAHGQGYDHMNGPASTGQPDQDCEELIADGDGSFPGQSGDNGSSAFGGSAGDRYAGSQPQNSRNSASVSQYDVACAHQPS